jgi:hypothetical protein
MIGGIDLVFIFPQSWGTMQSLLVRYFKTLWIQAIIEEYSNNEFFIYSSPQIRRLVEEKGADSKIDDQWVHILRNNNELTIVASSRQPYEKDIKELINNE